MNHKRNKELNLFKYYEQMFNILLKIGIFHPGKKLKLEEFYYKPSQVLTIFNAQSIL